MDAELDSPFLAVLVDTETAVSLVHGAEGINTSCPVNSAEKGGR
jgi:hypothetical protein